MKALPIAALALLAGCTVSPRSAEPLPQVAERKATAYVCDNGELIVTESDAGQLFLYLPASTVALRQDEAGWYGEGVRLLREDSGVRLKRDDEPSLRCAPDRAETRRQDARLRGVLFRAQGNDPKWQIEIGPEFATFAAAEEVHLRFPMPDVGIDPAIGDTAYRFARNGRRLNVQIVDETCRDQRTGERFDASIRVVLDDRAYEGCGEALH